MALRILLFVILFPIIVSAQQDTVKLSGIVKDKNNEPYPFASIAVRDAREIITGTYADIDGYFSLTFPFKEDSFIVNISFMDKGWNVLIKRDTLVNKVYDFYRIILSQQQLTNIYEDAYKYILKDKTVILTTSLHWLIFCFLRLKKSMLKPKDISW